MGVFMVPSISMCFKLPLIMSGTVGSLLAGYWVCVLVERSVGKDSLIERVFLHVSNHSFNSLVHGVVSQIKTSRPQCTMQSGQEGPNTWPSGQTAASRRSDPMWGGRKSHLRQSQGMRNPPCFLLFHSFASWRCCICTPLSIISLFHTNAPTWGA
jgi:hypothetical protein